MHVPGLVVNRARRATKGDGHLRSLVRYATLEEIRRAGRRRITERLLRSGVRRSCADPLVDKTVAAAQAQRTVVPGQAWLAKFVREFATEATTAR